MIRFDAKTQIIISDDLSSDLAKGIEAFRKSEKLAYEKAGIDWPY